MFALILSLCIGNHCNDYIIDSSPVESECHAMLDKQSSTFAKAWNSSQSNKDLSKWLKPYQVLEPVKRITSYNFTCPFIPDSEIP